MILLVAGFLAGSNSLAPALLARSSQRNHLPRRQTRKEKKEAEKAKKEQAELLAKEQVAKELAAIAQQARQQQREWAKKLKVAVERLLAHSALNHEFS